MSEGLKEAKARLLDVQVDRLEYLVKHLIDAVIEHGELHRNIEKRNCYAGGFPEGLISDQLEWIDLKVFEKTVEENTINEEADEGSSEEEQEARE